MMKVVCKTFGIITLNKNFFFLFSLGETPERINQFKKWFWSVLEKFNAVERQDLVSIFSFWII